MMDGEKNTTSTKILVVETHFLSPYEKGVVRTSAVDWYRLINPYSHLAKNTGWDITIQKGLFSGINPQDLGNPQTALEISNIGANYDLIVFSYMENPWVYSVLGVLSERYGLKFVIDFDDNLLSLSPYNPITVEYQKDPRAYRDLKIILQDAPYLTVTNRHLKDSYKKFRNRKDEHIKVLPNHIDLDVYKLIPQPKKEQDVLTIGYHGGVAHYGDLLLTSFWGAMSYILGKYQGKVRFSIVGFMPETELSQIPNVVWRGGDPDFYKWVKIWQDWTPQVDIGVAPLEDTEFNECKSNCKWQEYAAAKIPTVASDFGPYKMIRQGKTGFKATTAKDWIEYLSVLIENEELRKEMGNNAYKEVKKNWTIQKNWRQWKNMVDELTYSRA